MLISKYRHMVMIRMAYVLFFFLLISNDTTLANESSSALFDSYITYKQEIAACNTVKEYRTMFERIGSADALGNLKKISPSVLESLFKTEKEKANDFIKNTQFFYIEREELTGDKAALRIRDKRHPEYETTVYFAHENGEWKIGK
jgi:hypothetical protein